METEQILFDGKPIIDAEKHFEDSYVIKGFVQKYLGLDPKELFELVADNAKWIDRDDRDILYRGAEIMRDKEIYAEFGKNSWGERWARVYRYTGFQYGIVKRYRELDANPGAKIILDAFKRFTINGKPFALNHAITTRYRDQEDNIGFHADKIGDIEFRTPIVSVSLGETREFHIARKIIDEVDGKKVEKYQFEKSFILESGDVFIIGWKTNLLHEHSIVPVKDEKVLHRPEGYVVGPRISIVARQIRTAMTLDCANQKAEETDNKRAPNKRRGRKPAAKQSPKKKAAAKKSKQ
jgi:alkylated DNA repair dioxygenase AlkB